MRPDAVLAPGSPAPAQGPAARTGDLAVIADRVRQRLLAADGAPSTGNASARGRVGREHVRGIVCSEAPLLAPPVVQALVEQLVAEMHGLGPLDPLLADDRVSDVMVLGGGAVWVERDGRLQRTGVRVDADEARQLIERVVAPLGLRIDRASPVVDARLPDGSRFHAVIPPLAIDGPTITIRRFSARAVPLERFGVAPCTDLLADAVRCRRNIIVSGGTGSGKTTLLNALAAEIPGGERVVTIEDAAELRLPGEHVVRMEARRANAEGAGEHTIRDLVRAALRMRPDRIIVGEVRGGEALDMIQAMSTGHAGSMSTCHANSPEDALRRLEVMALMADVAVPLIAVQRQLLAAVDLVVQVVRGEAGQRVVSTISCVDKDSDTPRCAPVFVRRW